MGAHSRPRGLEGPAQRAVEALTIEADEAAGEAHGVVGSNTSNSGVFQ